MEYAAAAIRLSEAEQRLFSLLTELTDAPLRAAGGWVRDKLLGTSSDDIDIAVEGISGLDLAYLAQQSLKTANLETHSVGVIHSNPEKSKHLETATTQLLGFYVDFVGLRKETYADDSRIPHVEPGTALEDAYRRDFTVNSLFYNLRTRQCEDFTGRGLADLAGRIIDTPLDPEITFSQDPLRMLRAIRFAAKLGFALSGRLYLALAQPYLVERLEIVSRSRFQQELTKCFSANAVSGIQQICWFPLLFAQIFLAPVVPFSYSIIKVSSAQACEHAAAFAQSYYQDDIAIREAVDSAARLLGPILSQPIYADCVRIALGFLAVVFYFTEVLSVDTQQIEYLRNSDCKKRIEDAAAYVIPLICCAQSKSVCALCKAVQKLLRMRYQGENVVQELFQADADAVVCLYALSLVPRGAASGFLQRQFGFYGRGIGILSYKPNVQDLPAVAARFGVRDKRLLAELKRQIVAYWLSDAAYPDGDRALGKFVFAFVGAPTQ